MKRFSRYFLLFSALFLLAFLFSCRSGGISASDKLTPEEQNALIDNARGILLKSGKFRLSPQEMGFIRNNEPEKGFAYTDCKEGKASFSWQVSETKRVIFIIEGDLLKKDRTFSVVITRQDDVIMQPANSKEVQPEKDFFPAKKEKPLGKTPSM